MKKTDQLLFEDFLQNRLTSQALESFRARLINDVNFKSDFDLFQEMEAFVEQKVSYGPAMEAVAEVSSEFRNADSSSTGIKETPSKAYILIIALLGLIAVSITLIMKQDSTETASPQMAMYEYPPPRSTRSVEIATTKIDSAIYYFDLRRMDESKVLFEQLIQTEPTNETAHNYLANIYFLDGAYKLSRQHLSKAGPLDEKAKKLLELVKQAEKN